MGHRSAPMSLACLLVTVTACATDDPATISGTTTGPAAETAPTAPSTSEAPDTTTSDDGRSTPVFVDLPDAVAVNVTATGDLAAIAWTTSDAVMTAHVDPTDGSVAEAVAVNGELLPFAHPIERPAIAIDADARVHVAFTAPVGDLGSVAYSVRTGDDVTEPVVVSGEPQIETVLVHMAESPAGQPAMAWLEDSSLTVATPHESDAPVERDGVDDQTCDCCNPVPILVGDDLVVAYRDLERTGTDVIRDVVAVWSDDGGTTYSPVVPIADESWFIDACPFSGPDIVNAGDVLVTSWMDARQTLHPDQQSTTVWVDRSVDGGRSFGADLAITDGGIHRWPMLAVDGSGVIHLVWETQDSEAGGISYAQSTDRGRTFTAPRLLVPNDDESGNRRSPSLAISGSHLLVTWIDNNGGHLALVETASLP